MAVQGWRTRVYVDDFFSYVMSYFCWFSPITSHDCLVFLGEKCFSRTLDGQSTRIWHVQIPVMAKIQSNIPEMQRKKQGVQPSNHCLLLIASLSLGRSFTGAQPIDSVPFRRLRREKTLRNGRFLNDQRIQTAFLDVHPCEYLVKNNTGNIP